MIRQRSPPRRSPARRPPSPVRKPEGMNKRTISDRERSPSTRDSREIIRTSSPSSKRDADSPPRRRQRIIPRYHCNLPKLTLPRYLNYF